MAIKSLIDGVFVGGIVMMGLLRAKGKEVSYKSWIPCMRYCVQVGVILFVITTMMAMPMILFPIIPGQDYENVAYVLISQYICFFVFSYLFLTAIAFYIDNQITPFQALVASVKLSIRKFKFILPIYILMSVMLAVSILFLGIPFVWTYPFLLMLVVKIYGETEAE